MIHQINQNLKENLNLKWEIGEFPFLAQKSKKEIQCGKIHLAKMGHAIYHSDRNFEENSDLKSVFAYALCGICYSCFSAGGGCNIHLAKTGHSIYHLDRNFEENSDLKSVFEYLLCGTCYSCFSAGGGVISTLPKWEILYIIWTAILRRIQI